MRTFKNVESENPVCIICGADEPDLIYRGKGENGFKVDECICKKCGFVYLNPRWTTDTYFRFYQTVYPKYWTSIKPKENYKPEYDGGSYYIVYQRLKKYFPDFKPHTVLDVGCCNGEKLGYIMQKFPDAQYFGIEPAIQYKTEIENRNITFISDDVDSEWENEYKGKFDFIIMRHTLEHFLNPKNVLEKIGKVLSETGMVYIAVPDAYADSTLLKSINFTIVHPYYFSEISITNLLLQCGLNVIKCGNASISKNHDLYIFGNQNVAEGGVNLNVSIENYVKQKDIFIKKLKAETTFQKWLFFNIVKPIARFKKMFFPKPLIKKEEKRIEIG